MSLYYNLTGPARKALVNAVSEILGQEAAYMGTPTFSYTVGDYTIDKYGTLTRHNGFDQAGTDQLIAALVKRGIKESTDKTLDFNTLHSTAKEAIKRSIWRYDPEYEENGYELQSAAHSRY